METLRNWINDLPQQFQGKRNIEILLGAFAKQMDELCKVYEDLKTKTTLDNAEGQNLRYIGDIYSLTTKDAHEILYKASAGDITDETYRKILQYKALQNNCDCTYYDIMDSINLLWDTDKIKYVETTDNPATIYIELPDVSIDGMDPALGRILAIKPSGVAMIYSNGYTVNVNMSGLEKAKVPGINMLLPIKESEDMEFKSLSLAMGTKLEETITATLIIWNDFWMLDGKVLLDGSKTLGAAKTEEVL